MANAVGSPRNARVAVTYAPIDEVRTLREKLPARVLLVLDAAYAEYVRRNDYEAGIELVATTPNTVMTRTFSKIHGLAGLRLGWAYCPEGVADALNRIRGPFNVSTPAMLAAAAAIEDTAHVQMSKAFTEQWRGWLTEEIGKLGLKVTPSVANFVLIHFPDVATAKKADAFLTARGLILRQTSAYKLPNALRMTVGTEEANRLVVRQVRSEVAPSALSGVPDVRALVSGDAAFSVDVTKIYADGGRASVAPEKLMRALLLQVFYSIRSERQVCEQLRYNMLFRWFVGLALDDPIWDHSTFSKNRDRLLEHRVVEGFFAEVMRVAEARGRVDRPRPPPRPHPGGRQVRPPESRHPVWRRPVICISPAW